MLAGIDRMRESSANRSKQHRGDGLLRHECDIGGPSRKFGPAINLQACVAD